MKRETREKIAQRNSALEKHYFSLVLPKIFGSHEQ